MKILKVRLGGWCVKRVNVGALTELTGCSNISVMLTEDSLTEVVVMEEGRTARLVGGGGLWTIDRRTAKWRTFPLAAVTGVLDGFLAQARGN